MRQIYKEVRLLHKFMKTQQHVMCIKKVSLKQKGIAKAVYKLKDGRNINLLL